MKTFKEDRARKIIGDEMVSAVFGLAVIIGIIAVFAFIMTKIDVSVMGMSFMSTAALAIGCFAGGYVSARRRKQSGLLMGALCGVFIFLVLMILGTVFSRAAQSLTPSGKLVTAVVCAAAGGVVGVNSKKL